MHHGAPAHHGHRLAGPGAGEDQGLPRHRGGRGPHRGADHPLRHQRLPGHPELLSPEPAAGADHRRRHRVWRYGCDRQCGHPPDPLERLLGPAGPEHRGSRDLAQPLHGRVLRHRLHHRRISNSHRILYRSDGCFCIIIQKLL